MRKLFVTIAVSVFGFWAAHGVAFEPLGPATLNLNAMTQLQPFQVAGVKTNSSATQTNVTTVYKSTAATKPFVSSDLLALLANSYNTTFPAGSQIGMTASGGILVLDKTGSNIVLDPSTNSVLTINYNLSLSSGVQTDIETLSQSGLSFSGNENATFTDTVTITYNDSALTTADTTHTSFQLQGLLIEKLNENFKTRFAKADTTFQGTGSGTVRGVNTILTGTINAKPAGNIPLS